MEAADTTDRLIRNLAARFRVITLGGVAVISHGLNRNTHDADVWVDPLDSPAAWAAAVAPLVFSPGKSRPVQMGSWKSFPSEALSEVIDRDGVFRVLGFDRPLDIFRNPNELEMTEFDAIWARAIALDDGTRVPDTIDLLVSKQATGRDKDTQDIAFLEAKAEREYLDRLPTAPPDQAAAMLDRFLTPKVAEAAATHPDPQVRALGIRFLRELAGDGDPFARDLLEKLE